MLSASSEFQDWPCFVAAFATGSRRVAIELPAGRLVDGQMASCEVRASESVLEDIVAGVTTLQKEHLAGTVSLSGDPDQLLRLAIAFDLCERMSDR